MRSASRRRTRSFRSPAGALLTLLAIGIIAVIAALVWPEPPAVTGRASAVDGDTLRIGGSRVRLVGLDAVEFDQTCMDAGGADWPCGRDARAFLDSLTRGGIAQCTASGRDRYRRILAHCAIDRSDLGEQIVRAGWAVAELEYGLALADARLNGRGIWSGHFIEPADWRRSHGEPGFDFMAWLMSLLGR